MPIKITFTCMSKESKIHRRDFARNLVIAGSSVALLGQLSGKTEGRAVQDSDALKSPIPVKQDSRVVNFTELSRNVRD